MKWVAQTPRPLDIATNATQTELNSAGRGAGPIEKADADSCHEQADRCRHHQQAEVVIDG
ncbi:MAG: hypothetical protein MZV49_25935 [Rhodopseudomonas palustris]|nr:hypothetical protein [Rhodopseudomonas palustris]